MSQKTFCDACGEETKSRNPFSPRKHLIGEVMTLGYADSQGNPVSGVTVDYDLCNRCYNVVLGAAVKAFLGLQGINTPAPAIDTPNRRSFRHAK